jgi:hypothetical protein
LSERWIAVPAYFASGVIVPHLHPEMLIASGRNAPQFKWRDAAATRVKNTRIRMAAAGHYIQDLQYRYLRTLLESFIVDSQRTSASSKDCSRDHCYLNSVCMHNMLHCIPRKKCYDIIGFLEEQPYPK